MEESLNNHTLEVKMKRFTLICLLVFVSLGGHAQDKVYCVCDDLSGRVSLHLFLVTYNNETETNKIPLMKFSSGDTSQCLRALLQHPTCDRDFESSSELYPRCELRRLGNFIRIYINNELVQGFYDSDSQGVRRALKKLRESHRCQ